MNTKKAIYVAVLAVGIGITVVCMTAVKRQQAAQEAARQKPAVQQRAATVPPSAPTAEAPAAPPVEEAVQEPQIAPPRRGGVATQPPAAPIVQAQPAPANAAGDQDPTAREALSYVGADPGATAYWTTAINNPDLPARERKNLIEDLNEDGLSDPSNPGPEDLPLIMSRIRLIDQLAPSAMDQVNADAFAEARNDLVNMVSDLTGQ